MASITLYDHKYEDSEPELDLEPKLVEETKGEQEQSQKEEEEEEEQILFSSDELSLTHEDILHMDQEFDKKHEILFKQSFSSPLEHHMNTIKLSIKNWMKLIRLETPLPNGNYSCFVGSNDNSKEMIQFANLYDYISETVDKHDVIYGHISLQDMIYMGKILNGIVLTCTTDNTGEVLQKDNFHFRFNGAVYKGHLLYRHRLHMVELLHRALACLAIIKSPKHLKSECLYVKDNNRIGSLPLHDIMHYMQIFNVIEEGLRIMSTNQGEDSEKAEEDMKYKSRSAYFYIKTTRCLYALFQARLMELIYLTNIYNETLIIPLPESMYKHYDHIEVMCHCICLYESFYNYYEYITQIQKAHGVKNNIEFELREHLIVLIQKYIDHFHIFRAKLTFEICPIYRSDITERSFSLFLYKILKRDLSKWIIRTNMTQAVKEDLNMKTLKKKNTEMETKRRKLAQRKSLASVLKRNRNQNTNKATNENVELMEFVSNDFLDLGLDLDVDAKPKPKPKPKKVLSDQYTEEDLDREDLDNEDIMIYKPISQLGDMIIPSRQDQIDLSAPSEKLFTEMSLYKMPKTFHIWPFPKSDCIQAIIKICEDHIISFEKMNKFQPGVIRSSELSSSQLVYNEMIKASSSSFRRLYNTSDSFLYLGKQWKRLLEYKTQYKGSFDIQFKVL